jgi:hypothetical protein
VVLPGSCSHTAMGKKLEAAVPVALTVNVAVCPAVTLWAVGCAVMAGAMAGAGSGSLDPPPPHASTKPIMARQTQERIISTSRKGYSIVELMISRRVSLCMEMPGSSYQDPPVFSRITESTMRIFPERSLVTKKIPEPWAFTWLCSIKVP